jgi:hypothetical protein
MRRIHQNSSISEQLSGAKFEDKKYPSEFFDSILLKERQEGFQDDFTRADHGDPG